MEINWRFDGYKLQALMELKGLSRKDCARAIGKTEAAFGLKVRGKSPFTVDELCGLANAFGVDPRSFFTQKANGEKKVA